MRDSLMFTDLEQRLRRLSELAPDVMNDPVQSKKMRKEILDSFLQNYVLYLESVERNLEVDKKLVSSEISAFKSRFADDLSYKNELNSMGLSEKEFETDTINRIKQSMLLDVYRDEVAPPGQEAIDSFIEEQQESRRLAHILFSFEGANTKDELDEQVNLAKMVLDSLQDGSDFADFARRHSDDGSKRLGGDLGFVERGQMVGEFEEAAFNLQKTGDMTSELVETIFGVHIIKLISVRSNPPMGREEAQEKLFTSKKQGAVNEQIRLLKSNAVLHLNPQHIDQKLYGK